MYQKIIENGYIISIVSGVSNGNITEQEYNQILEVIRNKPQPPEGHDYKFREDLTLELYELPVFEEDLEELETEYVASKDYEAEMQDALENS